MIGNILLLTLAAIAPSDSLPPTAGDRLSGDTLTVALDDSSRLQRERTEAHAGRTAHPWRAAAEVVGTNLGILAFDHYVLRSDFAQVTWHTIGRNLAPKRWYWDSDNFRTNLMEHPYHGSLYFDAARANGLSFYESVPYAVGGSLMWELAGESEQPSINDFLTTTFGGVAIGEPLHRLQAHVYDNSLTGVQRVCRELIGAVISPMHALNRLLSGEAWRLAHPPDAAGDEHAEPPFRATVVLGARHWGTGGGRRNGLTAALRLSQGSPFMPENTRPYDYFTAETGIATGQRQSIVSHVNVIGLLRGWMLGNGERSSASIGIYHHFDYYATDSIRGRTPYCVSEAASVGLGLAARWQRGRWLAQEEFFANAVALGGTLSDYQDNPVKRIYSVGSGYSLKSVTTIACGQRLRFELLADLKHLFSWHGYEDEDSTKPYLTYSTMGERGHTLLLLLRPRISWLFLPRWGVSGSLLHVRRHAHYKYRPNCSTTAFDLRCGLTYTF